MVNHLEFVLFPLEDIVLEEFALLEHKAFHNHQFLPVVVVHNQHYFVYQALQDLAVFDFDLEFL